MIGLARFDVPDDSSVHARLATCVGGEFRYDVGSGAAGDGAFGVEGAPPMISLPVLPAPKGARLSRVWMAPPVAADLATRHHHLGGAPRSSRPSHPAWEFMPAGIAAGHPPGARNRPL
jgi:hypothetical protein